MRILDCTLRDGANVVGSGFDSHLTTMIIEGLYQNNIVEIEMGHAYGYGMPEKAQRKAPLLDHEYLALVQPYLDKAEIGMFMGVANASAENIEACAAGGLHFLRIGANAGDGARALDGIRQIKKHGMKARFAMMKGYILSANDLAEEAKMLEAAGLDEVTIMDSAGTMMPDQVAEYVTALKARVNIPVGFHGHNNLGLSVANAISASQAGVDVLDSGLMGMARSAGNLATEMAVGVCQRLGLLQEVNFLGLLSFIDAQLAPAMAAHNYQAAVTPAELVLGLAGCHSNFYELFNTIAAETGVNLYQLILDVSKQDRKQPSESLIRTVAENISAQS